MRGPPAASSKPVRRYLSRARTLSLAVNSALSRSQDQLHIHVDCMREDVRAALRRVVGSVGASWMPLPEPLAGNAYLARRVLAPDLAGVNPFLLLAAAAPDARQHMGDYTLFVAGADFAGQPGFILLADRADPAHGDFAGSEALQDHTCALAQR